MKSFIAKCIIYIHHLGHPRVTVARQSDWALFALGLNLANSAPLCTGKKRQPLKNWTPQGKQTSSKDIWSGEFPFLSNTFTHLHWGHFSFTSTWRFGSHCTNAGLCIECAVDALAVPSDEHTPLSEIVVWLQVSKESIVRLAEWLNSWVFTILMNLLQKKQILQVIICDDLLWGSMLNSGNNNREQNWLLLSPRVKRAESDWRETETLGCPRWYSWVALRPSHLMCHHCEVNPCLESLPCASRGWENRNTNNTEVTRSFFKCSRFLGWGRQ
jgi:hypothetical protein